MGIQSASATLTRFFVPNPVTEDFWGYVDEKIKTGAFKECEDGQDRAAGFSAWDDLFDSSFTDASYHKGEYVTLHFRLDQRKIPPLVVKQHVRQAVQKHRAEHNGRWPGRREKQEIQENVLSLLTNRALPQPSGCQLVWNSASNWMLLGTANVKMINAVLEYFEHHFRLYPIPLYHAQWAAHLIALDGRQKDILSSLVSLKSPQAMHEGRFLGYEFLTWLWFLIENPDDAAPIAEKPGIEVQLGERLILAIPGGDRERVICTTRANVLHEARTALRHGKLVEEVQIFMRVGENEYLLTLDSFLWAIRGLRTPKQLPYEDDREDPDGRFFEKMFFLEEVLSVLNGLYARFLRARLSPGWESDTLPSMKQWIEGGNQMTVM